MTIEDRIAKLPVWAREHITNLERRAATAERDQAALFDSQKTSRVTYGDHDRNPRYLPDGRSDSVRYSLTEDGNNWIELIPGRENIGYYGDPDMIVRGSDGFTVLPQSSNSVGIRLVRRPEGE